MARTRAMVNADREAGEKSDACRMRFNILSLLFTGMTQCPLGRLG